MRIGNWQLDDFLQKYRYPLLFFLLGLVLIVFGGFLFKSRVFDSSTKIEVLNNATEGQSSETFSVEAAGEVINPGVYKMPAGSRVDDLLIAAGGFSENANREWTDKYLNRAAKLSDGQKVYIPSVSEHSGHPTAR
jgi:DNA uptake protein ComE-like DNA-binding protein